MMGADPDAADTIRSYTAASVVFAPSAAVMRAPWNRWTRSPPTKPGGQHPQLRPLPRPMFRMVDLNREQPALSQPPA